MNSETSSLPRDTTASNQEEEGAQLRRALDLAIGNCNKCYNRRFIGYNMTTKKPVWCSCYTKFMRKVIRTHNVAPVANEALQKM